MRILLLNDNPVVRKLVALSAQKTKDDLHVVWSVDEIEHPAYDLLIIDDALYNDESFSLINQKITYKTSLLMATRGSATPAGFDKVINKPFLPTDLVELFSTIEKSLSSMTEVPRQEHSAPMIDLDDLLDESDEALDTLIDEVEIDDMKTNILDQVEVQELQSLLEDTDDDGISLDDFEFDETPSRDALSLGDLDELADLEEIDDSTEDEILGMFDDSLPSNENKAAISDSDEFDNVLLEDLELDEELPNIESIDKSDTEEIDRSILDELGFDDIDFGEDEDTSESLDSLPLDETLSEMDEIDDALLGDTVSESMDDELDNILLEDDEELGGLIMEEELKAPLSDDEFDALEQQIHDAVGELEMDDMETEITEDDFSSLGLGSLDDLDPLDMLDEKEIKLSLGEEIDEEPEIRVGEGVHSSLDAEALNEALGITSVEDMDEEIEFSSHLDTVETAHSQEGMEALQALLKALSNEEVAKSLKGLNISININFGNDK